jgi:nitroimidazol reductase NimA-like FMN-containing flavoprotein (pyridoxamine 5'-phosphate oxidase superfamily)
VRGASARRGVGRVVFVSSRGPVAHPLSFAVSEGDVIVSTTVDHARRLEDQPRVSFQIDRVDESMGEGWSVLVTGPARRVDDSDEAGRWPCWATSSRRAGHATPWSASIPGGHGAAHRAGGGPPG